MLAIRLQRTGRKGHAQFRLVVQDSHTSPKSGKVVAQLGNYDPHTKAINLDKEKASFYLEHGAQPSDRIVSILQKEGVKLPKWVTPVVHKERTIRNGEKLRKNQPATTVDEKQSEEIAEPEANEEVATEEVATETNITETETETEILAVENSDKEPETEA